MPPSHTWSPERSFLKKNFLLSYKWLDGNVIPEKARGWLILNRLPHFLAYTQPSLCLPVSLSVCFGSWCLMAGLLLTLWHLVQTLGPIYGIIKTSKSQRRTILHIWLSAPFSVTPSSPNHVSVHCRLFILVFKQLIYVNWWRGNTLTLLEWASGNIMFLNVK